MTRMDAGSSRSKRTISAGAGRGTGWVATAHACAWHGGTPSGGDTIRLVCWCFLAANAPFCPQPRQRFSTLFLGRPWPGAATAVTDWRKRGHATLGRRAAHPEPGAQPRPGRRRLQRTCWRGWKRLSQPWLTAHQPSRFRRRGGGQGQSPSLPEPWALSDPEPGELALEPGIGLCQFCASTHNLVCFACSVPVEFATPLFAFLLVSLHLGVSTLHADSVFSKIALTVSFG